MANEKRGIFEFETAAIGLAAILVPALAIVMAIFIPAVLRSRRSPEVRPSPPPTQTQLAPPKAILQPVSQGNGSLIAPIAIQRVEPDFSKCKGMYSGNPMVEATVGTDGTVSAVKLLRSADRCIDAAFVDAVHKWRFKPATRNGAPTTAEYTIKANVNYK